jgi:hypothetical protein
LDVFVAMTPSAGSARNCGRQYRDLLVIQIRRDFDQQRNALADGALELRALLEQRADDALQPSRPCSSRSRAVFGEDTLTAT